MLELAVLWREQNFLVDCERQCLALLRVNAKHSESAMLLADIHFRKQDYETASAKFRLVLEQKPGNYLALSKLIQIFRCAGRLNDVPPFIELAVRSNSRAMSHPGLNFCRGLHCRYSNNLPGAIRHFNLARSDGGWGALALINMIEIYLNPDNETRCCSVCYIIARLTLPPKSIICRWDGNLELKYYSGTAGIVVDLFKDLETFTVSRNIALKIEVLKAYSHLANQPRGQTEKAMKSFIGILEREKDYLPALLGMSTAFLFDQSTTKARNALKRIARMPYSYALAEHFERGYLLLADIYVQKCKFDLSEDLCSRCLKYNLSCGKAWETMGSIREKEASYKDAADMYEKVQLPEFECVFIIFLIQSPDDTLKPNFC